MQPAPEISIVVANWEGNAWLRRCLSSLQLTARLARVPTEILVVDDASTDGSAEMVREAFPRVRLFRNARNLGFARTINRGARLARGRVLVLCNNDIVAQEPFLPALYRWFTPQAPARPAGSHGPLFAVSARTVAWYDGRPNQLCMGAQWRGGRITPAWSDPREPAPCLFAQAGAAAYDRALFLRLGGLSLLYEPGYWEDYDLSWRAARRGFAQLYDPEAFALHVGGGSMSKRFGADGVRAMKTRNHLLFEMANLTSPRLLAEWGARVPLQAMRDVAAGRPAGGYATGLLDSVPRLRAALRQRLREPAGISDLNLLRPWLSFTPSF